MTMAAPSPCVPAAARFGPKLCRALALAAVLSAAGAAPARGPEFEPADELVKLDQALNWADARLLAVQDEGRYKTLDSFAREVMSKMTAVEHLPELSPLASTLEWVFNRDAYLDHKVVYIKDRGLRIHFSAHMSMQRASEIRDSGYMTPRELLADPVVRERIEELAPRTGMNTAMGRVADAQSVAAQLDRRMRILPARGSDPDELWHSPDELVPNYTGQGRMVAGYTPEQSMLVLAAWASLRDAWLKRDAVRAQTYLDKLAALLPTLALGDAYPSLAQRSAEARYYSWAKFTSVTWLYFLGMLVSILALVTRWRLPWWVGMVLLVLAMSGHAYSIGLRWYILGRIPVANMFEAITAAAWVGIAVALLLEAYLRPRVFLFAAHAAGFLGLLIATQVLPGGGTLGTIRGILDDVMLRIHTTLIISSYALVFIAACIALVYLFAYYYHMAPARSIESGLMAACTGAVLWIIALFVFRPIEGVGDAASGFVKVATTSWAFGAAAIAAAVALSVMIYCRASATWLLSAGLVLVATGTVAIADRGFTAGLGWTLLVGGLLWAGLTLVGLRVRRPEAGQSAALGSSVLGTPVVALAGGGAPGARVSRWDRPLLAGGAPGDESPASGVPGWLNQLDWCHLIILNLVFVLLFVGIILGAIWADYSWGRPWGWDPKEVFAMNTWIIYAILIHVRFVVQRRGLWTAWLSVAGCLMMAFNWAVVNFYIVGLHSYA